MDNEKNDNINYIVDEEYKNQIKNKLINFKTNSYIEQIQSEFFIMLDYIKRLENDIIKLKRENTKLKKENKFIKKFLKENKELEKKLNPNKKGKFKW